MFFFGDPADIAQNYITEAMSEPGPDIHEAELEDMTVEQLTYATIYVRMAFERAKDYDDAPREVLDEILEVYEELFCHLLVRDPEISRNFRIGNHKLLEYGPGRVDYWTALVDKYAPSAN